MVSFILPFFLFVSFNSSVSGLFSMSFYGFFYSPVSGWFLCIFLIGGSIMPY